MKRWGVKYYTAHVVVDREQFMWLIANVLFSAALMLSLPLAGGVMSIWPASHRHQSHTSPRPSP